MSDFRYKPQQVGPGICRSSDGQRLAAFSGHQANLVEGFFGFSGRVSTFVGRLLGCVHFSSISRRQRLAFRLLFSAQCYEPTHTL